MGSLQAIGERQPRPLPFASSQGHHQHQRRSKFTPLAGLRTVQPLLALVLLAATPACVHHASARARDHSLDLPAELSASLGLTSSGSTKGGLLESGVKRRAASGEARLQGGGSEGQGYERALQASGKARAAAGAGARTAAAAGAAKDGYSALCVVGKNENRYVREWVEYHKCLGECVGGNVGPGESSRGGMAGGAAPACYTQCRWLRGCFCTQHLPSCVQLSPPLTSRGLGEHGGRRRWGPGEQ